MSALDSLVDKGTKLELAERAGMMKHLQDIAQEELKGVRQLKSKHLGGKCAEGDDMGDIIVGDDIHFHEPPGPPPASRAWPMAFGITLGGGLIALALVLPTLLERLKPAPVVPQPVPSPTIKNTTIEKKSGFIIDLPGAIE